MNKRLGKCYQLSWQFVSRNPGWKLVHGSIEGFGNPRIEHAWCETITKGTSVPNTKRVCAANPAEVFDSVEVYDPVMDITWPKDAYYRFTNAKVDKIYTIEQVMKNGAEFKHYGPW